MCLLSSVSQRVPADMFPFPAGLPALCSFLHPTISSSELLRDLSKFIKKKPTRLLVRLWKTPSVKLGHEWKTHFPSFICSL